MINLCQIIHIIKLNSLSFWKSLIVGGREKAQSIDNFLEVVQFVNHFCKNMHPLATGGGQKLTKSVRNAVKMEERECSGAEQWGGVDLLRKNAPLDH